MEQEYERTEGMPEEAAPQETPEESAPERATEAVWSRLSEELTGLYQDGWPIEQLQAFAEDEGARAQIAAGATARQAATAYLMRAIESGSAGKEVMQQAERETGQADGGQTGEDGANEAEDAAPERRRRKRGVPALRAATTGGMPLGNAIERMSGSEFARFSDEVYARLMAG